MNKTVNINLAGIFFHIDENAYLKLQRYLEAIRRSFTDSQGRSEIISDIEARISELFTERVKHDKQVIGTKEVDEVISIMGQPEDYLVDDEIFEDEPQSVSSRKTTSSRKLFRDTDNSYVGGVSSGLGHYFGIDAIWIRLAWIVLIFGAGTGILLYVLLWILVPEAKTTSEKLIMKGEKVTITNIEKKIRDGFETVSETVKSVDFQKHGDKLKEGIENVSDSISESVKRVDITKQGNRIKSSSKTFFDTLADVFMFFIKLFAKFIGLILMFTGAVTVIALTVSLIVANFIDSQRVHFFDSNFLDLSNSTGAPLWLISILIFFGIAIPFLMLFYLGLKILVNNLKSMGNVAKFTMLGLWILSIIGLSVIGARQGLTYKEKAVAVKTEQLYNITANDTLFLSMRGNDYYAESFYRNYGFNNGFDANGEPVKYSRGVRLIVKSTRDSVAKVKLNRSARGSSYDIAKDRAENISYNYSIENKELNLDNHFIIAKDDKNRDQEVEVTIYLPVGSVLFADEKTYSYHSNNSSYYNDILEHGMENHYLKILNDDVKCLDCLNEDIEDDYELRIDLNNDHSKLILDEDGLEAKTENVELNINDEGLKAKSKNVNVKIDEDGIEITSKKGSKKTE